MKQSEATIVQEYGPFEGVQSVHGVTWDGERVWFANNQGLTAFDPQDGKASAGALHLLFVLQPVIAWTIMIGLLLAQAVQHHLQSIGEKVLAAVAMPVHIARDALGREFPDRQVRQWAEVDIGYMRELEHGASLNGAETEGQGK